MNDAASTARRRALRARAAMLAISGLAACSGKDIFVGDGSGAAGVSGAGPSSGSAGTAGSGAGRGGSFGSAGVSGSGGSGAAQGGGSPAGGSSGSGGGASGVGGSDAGAPGTAGDGGPSGAAAGGAAAGDTASGGSGGVDCQCARGGHFPVCGVDGVTYEAICGIACVPVDIACEGNCPCANNGGSGGGASCAPASFVQADGCTCYQDSDCGLGLRCYSVNCAAPAPGSCQLPPPSGCFGDADCPDGELCTGGYPTPCGTTLVERVGTCAPAACPEGDCGAAGPDCTCRLDFEGGACVEASGPQGSGHCRSDDGTCYTCKCASPDTPIATPDGDRPIASLRAGDLVYSLDGEQIRAGPIVRVNRVRAVNHHVLRLRFTNGATFDMSPGHPLADGRALSALEPGSALMGGTVESVETIAYAHPYTYDILPASASGTYFASGVLVGSTLAPRRAREALHGRK
jgi:hypothetical protein